MAASLEKLRLLGFMEKVSTVRNHLHIYNSPAVTATYKRSSNEPLKPALFRALATVISQHAILSVIPMDEHTENPYYARLPTIDLDQAVSFITVDDRSVEPGADDAQLDALLEARHNMRFTYKSAQTPFWYIVVLQGTEDASQFTLSIFFHHALLDTMSCAAFHEALAAALANPFTNTEQPSTIVTSPNDALPPPLEEVHGLPLCAEYIQKSSKNSQRPANSWTGGAQQLPVKSRFKSMRLPADVSSAFASVVKRNETTVSAAIQALVASTLFSVLLESYTFLRSDCAVSMLRWLNPPAPKGAMGCYIGIVGETYSRGGFTWDEARRCRGVFDRLVASKGGDLSIAVLKDMDNMHEWFKAKIGKERASAWELSNIGIIGCSTRGSNCEIRQVTFSQSAGATSAAIKVSVATGGDGRMAFGFSWQTGVVDDAIIEQLMHGLRTAIDSIADSTD